MNKTATSLTSGLAGAATLTAVHQAAQHLTAKAPRLDVLGMRALQKSMRKMGRKPPSGNRLYTATLAGDLIANAVYYSLVGMGKEKGAWWKASLLGVGAGAGAILLPPVLGLGKSPTRRTVATEVMTVAWYTTGAMVSAALMRALTHRDDGKAA